MRWGGGKMEGEGEMEGGGGMEGEGRPSCGGCVIIKIIV